MNLVFSGKDNQEMPEFFDKIKAGNFTLNDLLIAVDGSCWLEEP